MDRTFDADVWTRVVAAVKVAARSIGRLGRRCVYSDRLIVLMYLWCVWHDRPLCWAVQRSHYNTLFRPRKLPSVSQFTRRVKTHAVQLILQKTHDLLAGWFTPLSFIDGKALAVSPVSRDPQAARGRVSGGWAKGYKLHAIFSDDGRIPLWSVTPLNVAEQSVALVLCAAMTPRGDCSLPAGALMLGDSNYDSAPLHKRAAATGARLLTPLRNQKRVKNNLHHPVTLRQMGPARREVVKLWREHADLAEHVMHHRVLVEGGLSALCSYGGGLADLPAWTRGLSRVSRWVGAKIILYHARWHARKERARAAAA